MDINYKAKEVGKIGISALNSKDFLKYKVLGYKFCHL